MSGGLLLNVFWPLDKQVSFLHPCTIQQVIKIAPSLAKQN